MWGLKRSDNWHRFWGAPARRFCYNSHVLAATVVVLCAVAGTAFAEPPAAQPVLKQGSCPSGYHQSDNYCVPGTNATFAIRKDGSCPSGYHQSSDYCVAGKTATLAIPKAGSCPSGYHQSGSYCLSNK